jgi:hypothetical protein
MKKNCFTRKIVLGVLAIIAAIVVNVSPCLAADEKPEFREYVSQGNYFKCSIPSGWSEYSPGFGLSAEEKKVYGITLFGPPGQGRVAPTISIRYYAPGNLLHKTMERFIGVHSASIFGLAAEGTSYSEVRQILIADREAKAFERKSIRYIGEKRSMNPEKIFLFEDFIVVPAGQGFYVLELSVPYESRNSYTGIFANVVKSFRPEQ